MSHNQLREDKTCLNCGHAVEDRFCPACGQENIETRQSFGNLVFNVFEDITHYEGKFWQSLKYLITRPGYLTKLYLNGKRKSYLPPIRFYVFASFITFLLPHYIPSPNEVHKQYTAAEKIELDSIMKDTGEQLVFNKYGLMLTTHYKSLEALDSLRNIPDSTGETMEFLDYWRCRKAIELRKYNPQQLNELFLETLAKNFPKSLFFFMPLFALVIRLFHKKKNFIYFDHAIFTLHYFSFMLLSWMVIFLIKTAFAWIDYFSGMQNVWIAEQILPLLFMVYFIFYFFRGHQVLYHENKWISGLKSFAIFNINGILFTVTFIMLFVITIMMIH